MVWAGLLKCDWKSVSLFINDHSYNQKKHNVTSVHYLVQIRKYIPAWVFALCANPFQYPLIN